MTTPTDPMTFHLNGSARINGAISRWSDRRQPRRTWRGVLGGLLLWLGGGLVAPTPARAADRADTFAADVELAPFVVNGQQLAISVHARSKRDRRYAEDFGEEVIKAVYASVTEETGKGLIIIGQKNEPHPAFVFRRFMELAEQGKLDPAVAERGPELRAMLDHWEHSLNHEEKVGDGDEAIDLQFEKIIKALPLPLEGIGAKLYQLAWAEKFDAAKVDAKLIALRSADLEGNLFAHFDWVFYLPPRGAFDLALKDLINAALAEEEDVGFFARTAIKGVLLVLKPKISKAIEGMRRGMMFMTVVQARTDYSDDDVMELTGAYMDASMPDFEFKGGKRLTPVEAVLACKKELAERTAKAATEEATDADQSTEPEPEPVEGS